MHPTLRTNAINYCIEQISEIRSLEVYAEDLHHRVANEDYFIIGYYQAKKWIEETTGVFEAIEIIQEYEKFNFGELYTDLSDSEKVANMLMYIACEEVLGELECLRELSGYLSEADLKAILKELQNL